MTLKQMKLFLAVADTGSFSKGGEAVSLAQSTASQHIRALEEEMGVRLFDRSATRAHLTEAGRLLYGHLAGICRQCDEAWEAVRRFQRLERVSLRVGASTIPAACLIPDLLGAFSAARPGVSLEVAQGDSRDVIRMLQEESVELAVVGGRFDNDAISYRTLIADRIVLAGLSGQRPKPLVSIEEVSELPLVLREVGSGTRLAVDTALRKVGIDQRNLRVIARLGSSEAVRRAVLSGAGYAFLSTLAVGPELADGKLIEIHVEGMEISRNFYLAWRKGRSISPAASAFMEIITGFTSSINSDPNNPLPS